MSGQHPPLSEFDPDAFAHLRRVVAAPVDTPVHHTKIDAERRHEEVAPAASLDPAFAWFYLGFAYALVPGLDRSLLEVYQAAGDRTIEVRTHRSEQPIVAVAGADFSRNPWAYLIQGVPQAERFQLIDFIASYRFRSAKGDYCLDFKDVRCADPLYAQAKLPMTIAFALPRNLQKDRRLVMMREPGVMLTTPMFGITNDAA